MGAVIAVFWGSQLLSTALTAYDTADCSELATLPVADMTDDVELTLTESDCYCTTVRNCVSWQLQPD